MWVICCGMRRSGSTLLYQLTERLVVDTGHGEAIGATRDYGPHFMAEITAQHGHKAGKLVLKTHEFNHDWRVWLEQDAAKGLYVYRNLYDVLVSASMNDPDVSLDDLDSLRYRADWLVAQHQHWGQRPNMLIMRYADLVGATAAAVMAIGDHLGIRVSQRWAIHLAWAHSVAQQRQRENGAYWRVKDRIRDGRVGMWRDYVTEDQAMRLIAVVSTVDAPELKV